MIRASFLSSKQGNTLRNAIITVGGKRMFEGRIDDATVLTLNLMYPAGVLRIISFPENQVIPPEEPPPPLRQTPTLTIVK